MPSSSKHLTEGLKDWFTYRNPTDASVKFLHRDTGAKAELSEYELLANPKFQEPGGLQRYLDSRSNMYMYRPSAATGQYYDYATYIDKFNQNTPISTHSKEKEPEIMTEYATELDTTVNALQAQQGMTTCEVVFDMEEGAQQYTYKIDKSRGWAEGQFAIVVPSHGKASVVKIVKIHTMPQFEQKYRLAWLLQRVEDPYTRNKEIREKEDDLRTNIINAEALEKAQKLADALGLSDDQKALPAE